MFCKRASFWRFSFASALAKTSGLNGSLNFNPVVGTQPEPAKFFRERFVARSAMAWSGGAHARHTSA